MILVYRNFGWLSGALLLSLLVFTPTLIMYQYSLRHLADFIILLVIKLLKLTGCTNFVYPFAKLTNKYFLLDALKWPRAQSNLRKVLKNEFYNYIKFRVWKIQGFLLNPLVLFKEIPEEIQTRESKF